jgi:uncharacterized OB-fold protein
MSKDRVTTLIGLDRKSDKELEQIFKNEMKKRGKVFSGTVTEAKNGETTEPRRPSPKGKLAMVKGGGLMEATAKLKAKGLKEGGMVVKDKIVSIDTSPNSGLITTKGFGAGRRT